MWGWREKKRKNLETLIYYNLKKAHSFLTTIFNTNKNIHTYELYNSAKKAMSKMWNPARYYI